MRPVTTKTVRDSAFPPGHAKVGGRKKGVTNKRTALLKDAVLAAAERAGKGDIVAYLERQAEENPVAFLGLLGKVLPLQLQGDSDRPLVISRVEYVIVDPRERAEALPRQAPGRLDG